MYCRFYKRYDGKPSFVVRVLKDIDTSESIVVCKDTSFAKEDNEHYYLIRHTTFCEQVVVDGVLRDKYVRQPLREIDKGTVRKVYEDSIPEPKSKPFTYIDDEYAECHPLQRNSGAIERRQTALYRTFAELLQEKDEADSVCQLIHEIEYDPKEPENLLE